MKQYAYHSVHRTIHSSGQIEYYKNTVDDKSLKVGGTQCIRTIDGYVIPLDIINGLPHMKMYPNTDKQWEELPHVILTSGEPWDPRVLDSTISTEDDWYNTIKGLHDGLIKTPFDEYGNYKKRQAPTHVEVLEPIENDRKEINVSTTTPSFRECYFAASNLNIPYVCNDSETVISASEPREVKKKPIDYERYKPYFLHVPIEKIRMTFSNSTQDAVNVMSGTRIEKTIKSPFPAHNVWRRNEPVATDTIFAKVPAIGTGGQTMAQFYVGRKSMVIDIYGMATEKEFVNTLEDIIRKRGAMDKLISDSARTEISARVKDILRSLCINDWQSEAQYQHQNFAERRWQHFKKNLNWYMNYRNVPPEAWLLCAQWIADVMNHTAEKSLGWRIPMQIISGETVDISILLLFLFWDVVYVKRYKDSNYSGMIGDKKSSEIRGRFVGFSWDVGHALTFKILTDDTNKIISRSQLRLGKDGENNLRLEVEAGAVPERVYIHSKRDSEGDDVILPTIDASKSPFSADYYPDTPDKTAEEKNEILNEVTPMDDLPLRDQPLVETVDEDEDLSPHLRERNDDGTLNLDSKEMSTLNPTVPDLPPGEMIDRTFLLPPEEDGQRYRAKILKIMEEDQAKLASNPEVVRFKCLVNGDYEEVIAYNKIVDYIERDQTWDGSWHYRRILSHQGPLESDHPKYKGSKYNLEIEWETGEITEEPLTKRKTRKNPEEGMWEQDPVPVAIYARDNNLLDTEGWRLPGMKKMAKTQQRIVRQANQSKLHSFRTKPIYMYGFLVPRDHRQAMDIDLQNGNTKWKDSEDIELAQVDEYDTFEDKGKGYKPGPDYKKINVHIVYAVKHDGRHKSRLVAGGHLTDTPIDSVYSSVVSLRGIRLLTFIAELNDMECWATDIGNAYLESVTKEKVYIIAGPEFGDREGHTLIIRKALYGLKSSGLRWHERFADVLRSMGFFPSKAENDIWMRDKGDHYEYIGVYVDDLIICTKEPRAIIEALQIEHKFKLKGTGPVEFHLGCDFERDDDGQLCYTPRKYIEKMLENYLRIFGSLPKPAKSPLVSGDHPELDTSELLDLEWTKIYQSLIGALQWVVQIGRWDITTAVMTLSRFRACPRKGHLERVCRIHGYLRKFKFGINRIRTDEPDYSDIPKKEFDWEYTCYSGAEEQVPDDAPRPLGKPITMTHYVDANLMHDLVSGRSLTGIMHVWNKTVVDTYARLQSTVENATFGSEFAATRTASEQVIDLRTTARYLGVPIRGESFMFGDNESVVNASSLPHSRLHKRHNALAYHKTRECIAAGIFRYIHINGVDNPADILSKHWAMHQVWDTLKPLLFWGRNNGDSFTKEEEDEEKASTANNADANENETPSSTTLSRGVTNVRLQSCVDGVTDEQTQDGGTYQDPPNGPADEDMTSQIPPGSRSHRNVDDISRSPEREKESEHT